MNLLEELDGEKRPISEIHIRIQQRNGKKCLTLIGGLASDLDLKKILRVMKKTFQTSGAVIKDDKEQDILQLAGDHRERVKKFMVKYKVWEYPDPEIRIHGV